MGKQAIEEAENPELLTDRQTDIYRAKGYSDEWIQRRVQTIETRKALTEPFKLIDPLSKKPLSNVGKRLFTLNRR